MSSTVLINCSSSVTVGDYQFCIFLCEAVWIMCDCIISMYQMEKWMCMSLYT